MPLIPPLLRRPTFRNFWLGQTISVFGDQITLLAIPIVAVLSLQANPEQMGLLTAVGLLPHLLFSLPAGVWLDKVHRRRRLMIIADLLRAAVIATIAITYVMGNLSLEQLFVVTFIVGSLAVVFDISWNTLFVTIAERDEYLAANALFSGSRSLAGVAGPSIGGALIQFLTAPDRDPGRRDLIRRVGAVPGPGGCRRAARRADQRTDSRPARDWPGIHLSRSDHAPDDHVSGNAEPLQLRLPRCSSCT